MRMKTYDGKEPEFPGYYWWLPECSRGNEKVPEHWTVIAWHVLDFQRQKSGIFVGPLQPPTDIK